MGDSPPSLLTSPLYPTPPDLTLDTSWYIMIHPHFSSKPFMLLMSFHLSLPLPRPPTSPIILYISFNPLYSRFRHEPCPQKQTGKFLKGREKDMNYWIYIFSEDHQGRCSDHSKIIERVGSQLAMGRNIVDNRFWWTACIWWVRNGHVLQDAHMNVDLNM